jgi:predicted CXXCH cytochrome family protein
MKRTIVAFGVIILLGLVPSGLLVKASWAHTGYGETVNGFCPSMPYTTGDCEFCHLADRSAPTPAKTAYSTGNLCYFCPNDAPCVGGACAAGAEASVPGMTRETGTSRPLRGLAYFLLPLGAVVGLRLWRRKK